VSSVDTELLYVLIVYGLATTCYVLIMYGLATTCYVLIMYGLATTCWVKLKLPLFVDPFTMKVYVGVRHSSLY